MKKFLAIAAALAVLVALSITILTGGEALSFSEPNTESRIDHHLPPNQSQPQDFAGAGSQYYYFGPDFMCQIFIGNTVKCFGSDANGVVSNAPTQSGFTNVDGGDTYACAFHQATRFNHCWGSITLRPTTVQPTATPEPTSTPEPTATAVPPGATPPAATATSAPVATATPEPDPCRVPLRGQLPITVTGQWTQNECLYTADLGDVGVNAPNGNRYYRYVSLVATMARGQWEATITSAEDTVMLLYRWNAQTESYDFVEVNDDLEQGNTNSRITWTPAEGGEYLFILTTYELETTGSFSLTIGAPSNSGSSSMEQSIDQASIQTSVPFERAQ